MGRRESEQKEKEKGSKDLFICTRRVVRLSDEKFGACAICRE
jgi:hypothetical protein